MNTSTIEQSERLKELGVDRVDRGGCILDDTSVFFYEGPALTLDDLHMVFAAIPHKFFPAPEKNANDKGRAFGLEWVDIWEVMIDNGYGGNEKKYKHFPRTKNHAEDWTNILIWLLENNHVTAEQVNNALTS